MHCTEEHRPIDRIAHHEPVELSGGDSVDGRVMVNNPDLVVRAAVDGLGIAYTIEAYVEPFLRSGRHCHIKRFYCPLLTSGVQLDSINSNG
jgi:DNA-binding transcriptional LysR family regulator